MKFIVNDHVVPLRAPDEPLVPYIVSFSMWVIGQGYAPSRYRPADQLLNLLDSF